MQASASSAYRPEEPIWVRLEQDVQLIRREMVTKTDLMAMLSTKADAAVSEERWKGVWQDIAEIRTEMRNRPAQQQQSFFQAMGCSINALYLLVAAMTMLGTLAAVTVSIIALVR